MNGYQLFYELTLQLISLYRGEKERDEVIEETKRLLNLREDAIKLVDKPNTEAERELIQKCYKLNNHLNELMNQEKVNIQKDMKEFKVKKESTTKYVNPYENINLDGMFYDRKK